MARPYRGSLHGDDPEQVDICPRRRAAGSPGELTLTKCCLLERGIEVNGRTATVPWGSSLDEIRRALRHLAGTAVPADAVDAAVT